MFIADDYSREKKIFFGKKKKEKKEQSSWSLIFQVAVRAERRQTKIIVMNANYNDRDLT